MIQTAPILTTIEANRCGECAVPSNHGCVPICSPTKDIICPTGEYFDGEDCRDLNLSKQMQCHDGEIVVNRQCTPICNIQGGCNGPDYDVSDEE